MVSFAPILAETAEDQHRYLEGHLVEVACLDCLACVRVRKNSEYHTSIQWTEDAVGQCAEFARSTAEDGIRPVHRSCGRLKASIARAVEDGVVHVGETYD